MTPIDLRALAYILASVIVCVLGLRNQSMLLFVISFILSSMAILLLLSQAYDEGEKNRSKKD